VDVLQQVAAAISVPLVAARQPLESGAVGGDRLLVEPLAGRSVLRHSVR
jgi:hypothetical protein